MKKFKFVLLAFMTTMMAFSFTACSDDDDVEDCLLYTSDAADDL